MATQIRISEIAVSHGRKVSDGNYGNEEASVTLRALVLAPLDGDGGDEAAQVAAATERAGTLLAEAADAVLARLKSSDSDTVRENVLSADDRAEVQERERLKYEAEARERQALRKRQEAAMAPFRTQIAEAQQAHRDEIAEMAARHDQAMQEMAAEYDAKVRVLEAEAATIIDTLKALHGEMALAQRGLEADYRERSNALTRAHDADQAKLREAMYAAAKESDGDVVVDAEDTPF